MSICHVHSAFSDKGMPGDQHAYGRSTNLVAFSDSTLVNLLTVCMMVISLELYSCIVLYLSPNFEVTASSTNHAVAFSDSTVVNLPTVCMMAISLELYSLILVFITVT